METKSRPTHCLLQHNKQNQLPRYYNQIHVWLLHTKMNKQTALRQLISIQTKTALTAKCQNWEGTDIDVPSLKILQPAALWPTPIPKQNCSRSGTLITLTNSKKYAYPMNQYNCYYDPQSCTSICYIQFTAIFQSDNESNQTLWLHQLQYTKNQTKFSRKKRHVTITTHLL